jgi:TPR repeat protein
MKYRNMVMKNKQYVASLFLLIASVLLSSTICFAEKLYSGLEDITNELNSIEDHALKEIIDKAESGNAFAQLKLGMAYILGSAYLNVDPAAAAKWFLKSSEQENHYSQVMLGAQFMEGTGVEKNPKIAFEWFLRAATNGNVEAQYLVGSMYLFGSPVEKNPFEAYKWLTLAKESTNNSKKIEAFKISQNQAMKQLTQEEIEMANNLIDDLKQAINSNKQRNSDSGAGAPSPVR